MGSSGFAMRHLTLSELLRPWATNGVTHLLVGPLAPSASEAQDLQEGQASITDGKKAKEAPSVSSSYFQSASGRPVDVASARGAGHKGFGQGTSNKNLPDQSVLGQTSSNQASFEQNTPNRVSSAEVLRDQWPEKWQALFRKTHKAPVVWTYSTLGLDLSGRGLPARSACLRTIIGRLGFPKGSSSFWPSSLPDADGVLQPDPAIFFSALSLLGPKVVIVAGEGMITSKILPLTLHTPFTQQVHQGRLYILLPGFSRMIDDSFLVDRACTYLRTALSSLVSLQKS